MVLREDDFDLLLPDIPRGHGEFGGIPGLGRYKVRNKVRYKVRYKLWLHGTR